LLLLAYFLLAAGAGTPTLQRGATLGMLGGALILTNPVTLLLLFAWPLIIFVSVPRDVRRKLAETLGLAAIVTCLIVAPWIGRNYARFGQFIFVRDNFGLELYTGNNACAQPTLDEAIESGCHAKTHPNATRAIAEQLAAQGEVAYNRAKLREGL